jgi:uncharacterized repeat protein (TIGR01451 family)
MPGWTNANEGAMMGRMGSSMPGVARRLLSVAAAGLVALTLGAAPQAARAQTFNFTGTTATGQTCLADRAGGALNCTANDFTTQASLVADNATPFFCQSGQPFTFTAYIDFKKGGGGSNYDIGFFAGESGNSPNAAGGTCSVGTAPGSPAPLNGTGSNSCGDWSGKGELVGKYANLTVTCAAATGATDANLSIPYVVSWSNSSSATCSGPSNVMTTVGSKCQGATATLATTTGQLFQVGGYIDVTKQTAPDADGQSFSYTVTGDAGTIVGYRPVTGPGGTPTGTLTTNNTASASFSLTDGQTMRVYMSVVAATKKLTIQEQPSGQPLHWLNDAAISCTGGVSITTTASTRKIEANLNTSSPSGTCTITNPRRARISLVKNLTGRLITGDQFKVTVSGTGSSTLVNGSDVAITAPSVAIATSGTGTGNFTSPTNPSFYATPGQMLTLADDVVDTLTMSPPSSYTTSLTCTNASTAVGHTTSLPTGSAVTTYNLTPAAGDDITCTYTNTPKAKLTLAKTVVNDEGGSALATAWTLTATGDAATGPTTISGASGSGTVTDAVVPVGTYTLSESAIAGYTQTSLACSGAADTDVSDGKLTLAAGETATCTFTNNDQQVAQSIDKDWALDNDADNSGTVTVGDTLRYTVTVTNTGAVALTNVQIADGMLSGVSGSPCASVAPLGTCVLTGTYVVTSDDETVGSVSNTATVTSNEIPGPVSSETTTTTVEPPAPAALAVTKSHDDPFSAGSNGSYTLQVRNNGGTAVSGDTTVTDTLATGLTFVSGTGTGWSCGAVGQLVTCTSSATVSPYSNMQPITLTVTVGASMGTTVDNTAAVANTTLNGGTPVTGNTDTATIVHPDLSGSTKGVNDLNGGDVETGDVLEYTITLLESAGAVATDVHVTDTVQSGLGSLTVTSIPAGATDNTSGGTVDVTGITVPANGSVQVKFRVTVGSFTTGDPINNTATVDNPAGPDATPDAPLLTFQESQIVVSGGKRLYLRDDQGSPTAQIMDRTIPATTTTGGVVAASAGGRITWTMSPTVPTGETLELDSGTVTATFPVNTAFNTLSLTANLYRQPGNVLIGSGVRSISTPNTVSIENFSIALNGNYAPLTAGQYLTLDLVNSTNGNNKDATVYAYNGGAAMLAFSTSTVVHVDSVDAYAEAYASGNTQDSYYVLGDTMYVRAIASDPFGGADVGSAEVTIKDASGATIAGPAPMTVAATAIANRTFEYGFTIPQPASLGTWTASVKAWEGQEGTISHTASGAFDVRGKVTLDQAWGGGSASGDTLDLQVTGGADPVDGSSVAPSAATPATAAATASLPLTLVQAFTVGSPGDYTIGLTCTRDADGDPVTVTGSGLSRQIQMPLDSSVTCIWTDDVTTPLTVVKLAIVRSDPINGATNPKAIPGATVEYQVIVTNPGANAVDAGSIVITDPLPDHVDLSVDDIAGPGTGPIQFVDGSPSSGMTYTFTALGNGSDDLDFSDINGWGYVPTPDGDGIDANVTGIRVNPKGAFNGNNAQFTLKFRVKVQ